MDLREVAGLATTGGYAPLCREERHFAAVLFGLMCGDRAALLALLGRILEGRPEGEAAWLGQSGSGEIGIYYEYSYLRDLWSSLGDSRSVKPEANARKRALIEAGLAAFGLEGLDAPADAAGFNRMFTSQESGHIMSPATWRLDVQMAPALHRAATLLKIAFRIKPDIVIELDGQPIVCFEAKVESGESRYDIPGEGRISQVEMQRRMFDSLLGVQPLTVLLSHPATKTDADTQLDWSTVFGFFDREASIMYEPSTERLSALAPDRPPRMGATT